MKPAFDAWTLTFLAVAAQGLFMSVLVFLRKSRATQLLGFLTLFFSLLLLSYVAFWTGYMELLPSATKALYGLTYTFGPLLYFYIRSDKKEFVFNAWHFFPFLISSIVFIQADWFSANFMRTVQPVFQSLHLAFYTLASFYFIQQNKGNSNGALKLYLWRKKVTLVFSGYSASFLLYYVLVWTGTLKIEYDYFISLASSFFIYFIGYQGFQHQELFKMYENGKYDKSSLSSSAAHSIQKALKHYMVTNKSYLDSTLTLQVLAEKMELSAHHISQVINDLEGKNFSDFINDYRINDARKLLMESDLKIIQVAYQTGYNNKASFHNAFKKITGLSPSEYRENQAAMVD